MKKQEALKRIEAQKETLINLTGWAVYVYIEELIKSIDEPQKPVVPQFVADWYEEHKDNLEFNIFDYVYQFDQNAGFDFKDWFDDFNTKPIQTLVNMHQFGYEVEKEPKYTVKIKSTKCSTTSLVFSGSTGAWFFSVTTYQGVRFKHTRKELEANGFGWVFSCEGIEIEEVTE